MSSLRERHDVIANQRKVSTDQALSLNGDGVTFDMIGDYSGAPVEFYYQAPPNFIYLVGAIALTVSDNTGFDSAEYGGALALVNGLRFYIEVDGVKTFLTRDDPVKNNSDLALNSSSFRLFDWSNNDNTAEFQLDFTRYADELPIDGDRNGRFGVELNDNFTALTYHRMTVDGATKGPKNLDYTP